MPYKNIEISKSVSVNQQNSVPIHYYKGFSTDDDTNRNSRLYDLELIKQDIINHFRTKKGERLMHPEFGSVIWDMLMDPLTPETTQMLKDDVETICKFDPRVFPSQIKVTEYPDGYLVEITLNLKNTDVSSTMKLTFDQSIGLTVL